MKTKVKSYLQEWRHFSILASKASLPFHPTSIAVKKNIIISGIKSSCLQVRWTNGLYAFFWTFPEDLWEEQNPNLASVGSYHNWSDKGVCWFAKDFMSRPWAQEERDFFWAWIFTEHGRGTRETQPWGEGPAQKCQLCLLPAPSGQLSLPTHPVLCTLQAGQHVIPRQLLS